MPSLIDIIRAAQAARSPLQSDYLSRDPRQAASRAEMERLQKLDVPLRDPLPGLVATGMLATVGAAGLHGSALRLAGAADAIAGNPIEWALRASDDPTLNEASTAFSRRGMTAKAIQSLLAKRPSLVDQMAPEVKARIKEVYGVDLPKFEVNRAQREAVDEFATQGGRGQVFTSYGKGYTGYLGGSPTEGGEHLVTKELTPRNVLFHKHEGPFIGDQLIMKFLGGGKAARNSAGVMQRHHPGGLGQQVISKLNFIGNALKENPDLTPKDIIEDLRGQASNGYASASQILKHLNVKDIERAREMEEIGTGLKETLAAKLARNAGYDTTVKLRKQTRGTSMPGLGGEATSYIDQAYAHIDKLHTAAGGPYNYNVYSKLGNLQLNHANPSATAEDIKKIFTDANLPAPEFSRPSKQRFRPTQVTLVDPAEVKKARGLFDVYKQEKPKKELSDLELDDIAFDKEFEDPPEVDQPSWQDLYDHPSINPTNLPINSIPHPITPKSDPFANVEIQDGFHIIPHATSGVTVVDSKLIPQWTPVAYPQYDWNQTLNALEGIKKQYPAHADKMAVHDIFSKNIGNLAEDAQSTYNKLIEWHLKKLGGFE
jgi:hypothetical protein